MLQVFFIPYLAVAARLIGFGNVTKLAQVAQMLS
jgi:hypothetical protein